MTCPTISPAQAQRLVDGGARLIDIRSADEFARVRLPRAENRPLDRLDTIAHDGPVVFHCKSGMRTAANAERLARAASGEAYIVAGGLDGWRKAGLAVEATPGAPMEIMRQVQITAGLLVLTGRADGRIGCPRMVRAVRVRRRGADLCRDQRLVRHGAAAGDHAVEPPPHSHGLNRWIPRPSRWRCSAAH